MIAVHYNSSATQFKWKVYKPIFYLMIEMT